MTGILLVFTTPVLTSSYYLLKPGCQMVAQQLLQYYGMNIPLLKSTFAGNVSARPASLKSVVSLHTKPPAAIPAGGEVLPINTGGKVTTYDSQLVTQDKPVAIVLNQFRQQGNSRVAGKSARLAAGSVHSGSTRIPSLVTQVARPVTAKAANKPVQPPVNQNRIKSEIVLSETSDKLPVSNAQFEKDKKPGKTFAVKEKLLSRENGKPPLQEILSSDDKTAADSKLSSHPGQKVLTAKESSIPAAKKTIAEKTISNKADTDRKDRHGKTEIFELPPKDRAGAGAVSAKSIAQKLSQPPAENRSNSLLQNHSLNPDTELSEQMPLGNNPRPAVTEQLPVSTIVAKVAGNADSGDTVGEQVQGFIHGSLRSGNQRIVVRLNPPELGKVAVKFEEQDNDITGLLRVDKPQTRDRIQQALPEIIQNLQDCGIQIKRLEVVLTNQQDQYASKDQSSRAGQDGSSEQQSSPNPQSQGRGMTYNEWLRGVDNVTEFAEIRAYLTDSSINMLI